MLLTLAVCNRKYFNLDFHLFSFSWANNYENSERLKVKYPDISSNTTIAGSPSPFDKTFTVIPYAPNVAAPEVIFWLTLTNQRPLFPLYCISYLVDRLIIPGMKLSLRISRLIYIPAYHCLSICGLLHVSLCPSFCILIFS